MKKLYIYPLALAFAAFALAACSSDDDELAPGEWNAAENYANVAFEKLQSSEELDPADATDAFIKVTRQNTSGAITVPVKIVTNTDGVFTVDPLTFADGEAEANLSFHFPDAEVGKPYTLEVEINDPNFVSEYTSVSTYSYTVTRVKWNDVSYIINNGQKIYGYAAYTEDLVTTFFAVPNLTFPTRLQERDDMPGYFRMVNTYGANYPVLEEGDWDPENDYYIYIDATDPDKVYIPEACNLGMDVGYGFCYVWSMVGLGMKRQRQDYIDGNYGTYENGVITFPKGALLFGMEKYNDLGFYDSNSNGAFRLVVDPDKDLYVADPRTDFTFENEFLGTLNSSLLVAKRDAMFQKGTCTNEKDDCGTRFEEEYGTLYRLQAPYANGYDLLFAIDDKGIVSVPAGLEEQITGLKSVNKDVFAVINGGASSYDAEGQYLKLTIEFFDENGLSLGEFVEELTYKPVWDQVGTGTYTYWAWDGKEAEPDPGYTFSKRPDKDDVYRIDEWFYGAPLEFTWDQETNALTVPFQSTEHKEDGEMIYVADYNTWFGSDDEKTQSYFDPEKNTFMFLMVYGTKEEGWTADWETFEVEFTEGGNVKAKLISSRPAFRGMKLQKKYKWNSLARLVPKKKNFKQIRLRKDAQPLR